MTTAERLFHEALECDKNEDYAQAFILYSAAAELGHVPAYANVGYAYLYGEGTQIDYDKAVEFLQKGADNGSAAALTNLGFCYSKGYGVPQDKQKALKMYQQAAEAGSKVAKENYETLKKELEAKETVDLTKQLSEFYQNVRNSPPNIGAISLYGAKETPVGLNVTADIVLAGESDDITVLPVVLPEYGIDIRLPVHNDLAEFELLTVKNVPSSLKPGKTYSLNIMSPKVQRRNAGSVLDSQENLKLARQLVQYYENNGKEPENFGPLRMYGPVEMTPNQLLIAIEMSFTGVGGMAVPVKLPHNDVEVVLGLHYKLQNQKPFLIHDITDAQGNRYEITVVPMKVEHKTGGPSAYAKKQMANANVKEYVDKLVHLQLGNSKQLAELEKRDLLDKAALEMYLCSKYPFGNKAEISENFLFHKNKMGLIIPCQDILWFYDNWKGEFFVGTRYHGIVKISGYSKLSKDYKFRAEEAIHYLQQRTKDLLVGNTAENEVLYNSRAAE